MTKAHARRLAALTDGLGTDMGTGTGTYRSSKIGYRTLLWILLGYALGYTLATLNWYWRL